MNNKAQQIGGAITITEMENLNIKNCTFSENTSEIYSGAGYLNLINTINIHFSHFYNNTSD